MKEIAQLLGRMVSAGIIKNYAVFGAVAQMRYTEPVATLDVDVLVEVASPDRLDVLAPIYEFCSGQGYAAEGEAIRVADWPLQLVPAFSALTFEALANAETADYEGVPLRVVRADYLAVIALEVGRPKDFARVLALLESGSATVSDVAALALRFGADGAWQRFKARFLSD